MKNRKIFFNGLNELRAFAALFVIFHHIELEKNAENINSLLESSFFSYFISILGKNGVYLFFVLSGFLITYLLLMEKEKYKTILFTKFYLRRIFRIWPLYYLIVFIGFVVIPFLTHTFDIFQNASYSFNNISNPRNYTIDVFLTYFFFLPNMALDYFGFIVTGCTQTWSVGVEEQFYILWPLLIFAFSKKRIAWIFGLIVVTFVFCHVFFQPSLLSKMIKIVSFEFRMFSVIYKIVKIIPFEFMAIGAVGGYLYSNYKNKIDIISKSKFSYYFTLLIIFLLMMFPFISIYSQSILLSLFFLCLILITINDDNSSVFRNKYLSYIGTISYGMYMYHPFVLFLVFPFVNKYFAMENNALYYNLLVYFFVFGLTILISHLSYKFFESVFIKIKDTKYKSL